MRDRRRIATFAVCFGLTVVAFGCGGDEPEPGDSSEEDPGGGDVVEDVAEDTGMDTEDAPQDTADTGAEDGTADGGDRDATGDVDGGGPTSCPYQGLEEGVCTEGVRVEQGVDAGGMVSGDAGSRCRAPETYLEEETPPDDEEPPYEDVCDGLDNDCDGVVDEGCPCDFLGREVGICNQGVISDQDGSCEPPEDYQTDETECDDVDNDCDGVVDEGCRCIYQGGEEMTGVCEQAEISAETGDCEQPEDFVQEETDAHCDSKDNDCDGEVDENCSCDPGETEDCYTGPSGSEGTGICEAGSRECQGDGSWGECTGDTTPASSESCNGEDDDCDGVVDEGCSCDYDGTSDGVCSNGQIGSQGNCKEPSSYEQDETSCDGVDNDCDGVVDENCPCAYDGTNTGVCGNATIDPSSGNCAEPDDYEETEQSCDDKDNDCDGDVDGEDSDLSCSCTEGETDSCYTGPSGTQGEGVCEAGTKTCQGDGSWGECTGETTPSSEDCDGVDNDCDGAVDEGCSCDYDGESAGVCEDQTRDSSGNCPEPSAYESTESTCTDNLDNDCDGDADCADSDCAGEVCGTGDGAICQGGDCVEQRCDDGIDNDKDGETDCADPDCAGESCGTGTGAICQNGECVEQQCDDGVDNDGDGQTDCEDPDCTGRSCGSAGASCCADDNDVCGVTC